MEAMTRARNQAQGQKASSKKSNICVLRYSLKRKTSCPTPSLPFTVRQGALADSGARLAASKHQQTSSPVSAPSTHLERVCLCVHRNVQQAIHGCLQRRWNLELSLHASVASTQPYPQPSDEFFFFFFRWK